MRVLIYKPAINNKRKLKKEFKNKVTFNYILDIDDFYCSDKIIFISNAKK